MISTRNIYIIPSTQFQQLVFCHICLIFLYTHSHKQAPMCMHTFFAESFESCRCHDTSCLNCSHKSPKRTLLCLRKLLVILYHFNIQLIFEISQLSQRHLFPLLCLDAGCNQDLHISHCVLFALDNIFALPIFFMTDH